LALCQYLRMDKNTFLWWLSLLNYS
jgi:hypothetical protein